MIQPHSGCQLGNEALYKPKKVCSWNLCEKLVVFLKCFVFTDTFVHGYTGYGLKYRPLWSDRSVVSHHF